MPLVIIGFFHCIYLLVVSVRKREMDLKLFLLLWALFHIVCNVAHLYLPDAVKRFLFRHGSIYRRCGFSHFSASEEMAGFLPGRGALLLVYTVFFPLFFQLLLYGTIYSGDLSHQIVFLILQTEAIAFIDEHPEYGEKGVQTAIPSVVYALSCLKSPYELGITLDNTFIENGYIHCSYLGPIEDGYYYIVDDTFPDYITELREKRIH